MLLLLALALLVLWGARYLSRLDRLEKNHQLTTARITGSYQQSGKNRYAFDCCYAFTVNGQEYTGWWVSQGSLTPGTEFRVFYCPADPSINSIEDPNGAVRRAWMNIAAVAFGWAVLGSLFGSAVLVARWSQRRAHAVATDELGINKF